MTQGQRKLHKSHKSLKTCKQNKAYRHTMLILYMMHCGDAILCHNYGPYISSLQSLVRTVSFLASLSSRSRHLPSDGTRGLQTITTSASVTSKLACDPRSKRLLVQILQRRIPEGSQHAGRVVKAGVTGTSRQTTNQTKKDDCKIYKWMVPHQLDFI